MKNLKCSFVDLHRRQWFRLAGDLQIRWFEVFRNFSMNVDWSTSSLAYLIYLLHEFPGLKNVFKLSSFLKVIIELNFYYKYSYVRDVCIKNVLSSLCEIV